MLDLILCDRLNELLRTAFRTRAQKQMLYEMFYIFNRVIMGLGGLGVVLLSFFQFWVFVFILQFLPSSQITYIY